MELFDGESADAVWQRAAQRLLGPTPAPLQKGRGGTTREILRAAFEIRDPRQRWVFSRQPAINPAFAIVELICLINGRNDAEVLNFWNPALPRFAGRTNTYQGSYGFRLKTNFGLDQLDSAYCALKGNPDSRQIVLQIWDPLTDFPAECGAPAGPDIACNICALLKVRDGRLEWTQVVRSNDLFRGVPYDFVQFSALQEILAGWLGSGLGSYTHFSDSLHVYESDLTEFSYTPVSTESSYVESLTLPYEESLQVFAELSKLLDTLRGPQLTALRMRSVLASSSLPRAFQNLILVVAADAARRRHWQAEAEELMNDCTNPTLAWLWCRWLVGCNARTKAPALLKSMLPEAAATKT